MDEREHHDEFYLHAAAAVFDAPLFTEVRRRMAAFLARHGRLSPRDRILSLGCGDGRVECLMAPLVGEIVGVELSSVAIEQARSRARDARLNNVRFEAGDVLELGIAERSFDAVWALGVLHHLDPAATAELLRRAHRALRDGGRFVSNDPSARRLVRLFKRFFVKEYDRYHSPDEHELNVNEIARIFRGAGFGPVTVHYSDYFLGPFAWLFPGFPAPLVAAAGALESFLLHVPGLRTTASSFCIVAHKRET